MITAKLLFVDYWAWLKYMRDLYPHDGMCHVDINVTESWSRTHHWFRYAGKLVGEWNDKYGTVNTAAQ